MKNTCSKTNKEDLMKMALEQSGLFTSDQAMQCGYDQKNHHYHVKVGQWEKVIKLWDKKYLRTPDGKELIVACLEFHGGEPNYQRLFLRKGKKVLWDKTFSQEYGAL